MVIEGHVGSLSAHERGAIWLQTDAATDWECILPSGRDPDPVSIDDVVQHILREQVLPATGAWSNERVRAFLHRSERRD